MEEKIIEKVERLLKENKQEELLDYKVKNKQKLLEEISQIDFKQLNKLYEKIAEKQEVKQQKIEPINYIDKEKLSYEERERYKKIGSNIIKNNQYAVVTMAGGQRNKVRAQRTKRNL